MPALAQANAARLSTTVVPFPINQSAQVPRDTYTVRLAHDRQDIEAAQRLRFEVFNIELGVGLARSFATGRDEDEWDNSSAHLLLIEQSSRKVVGTYRLRTYENAKTPSGFYSSIKFNLGAIPAHILESSIELERACIAKAHRNTDGMALLWQGVAEYATRHQKRYLLSCCSLISQDPLEGGRVFDLLSTEGHLHPQFRVSARPGFKCIFYKTSENPGATDLPELFRSYLGVGASFCGMPALDRDFRTIDFLALLDLTHLSLIV